MALHGNVLRCLGHFMGKIVWQRVTRPSVVDRREIFQPQRLSRRSECQPQLRSRPDDKPFCRAWQRDDLASAHGRGHGGPVQYISARKELIHAMSLNADRTINRAKVAECAISATRNHLKLHMAKTLSPLLCSLHAKTQKLRKRSAMRVTAFRPHAWSANHLLMHSACPTRCPPRATPTSARAGAMPSIEDDANTQ